MAALVSVVAVLLLTVQIGPRLPGTEALPAFGSPAFDYDGIFGRAVPPLTQAFVDSILGRSSAPATDSTATRTGPVGSSAAQQASAPGRTLLEHALTNDDFGDALLIPSVPFTARTDDSDAGRESGEPTACSSSGRTVWYRYRPTSNIGLVANTFGSAGPSTLGVYRGNGLQSLTRVDCDDSTTGAAYVPFAAEKDVTYHFQITRPVGGRLVFNLDPLGRTTRESVSTMGAQADDASAIPALSEDGRFVTFTSMASDLVDDDRPCPNPTLAARSCLDVFVRDRSTGRTELVSVNSAEQQGNEASIQSVLSGDGRYVSFTSWANNLVGGDTNGWPDVFVRDRKSGRTERVSVTTKGQEGTAPAPRNVPATEGDPRRNPPQEFPSTSLAKEIMAPSVISPDGRFFAFSSRLNGLVLGDTDHDYDVFVRDRKLGTTQIVSRSSSGALGDADSVLPAISADGRHVAFNSLATNLVAGDTNDNCVLYPSCADVFVHDRVTRKTTRVSVASNGEQGNDESLWPAISDDGRLVAFTSKASNLVRGDEAGTDDVFVHDRASGSTTRVSVSSGGESQPGGSELGAPPAAKDPSLLGRPSFTGDGRYVAFYSTDPNLGPDDPGITHVFVHDRRTRATVPVSVSSSGRYGNDNSHNPVFSRSGSHVTFSSRASNLVGGDTNSCVDTTESRSCPDVFVHEFGLTR